MAKITDTIELVDGVSDVLRRIGDRAEDTANRMLGTAGATRAAANSMETLGSRISGVKSFILGMYWPTPLQTSLAWLAVACLAL